MRKLTYTSGGLANNGDRVRYSLSGQCGEGKLVISEYSVFVDISPRYYMTQGRNGTRPSSGILVSPSIDGCLAKYGVDWSMDYPVEANDYIEKI